jgi:hypothetical protein
VLENKFHVVYFIFEDVRGVWLKSQFLTSRLFLTSAHEVCISMSIRGWHFKEHHACNSF